MPRTKKDVENKANGTGEKETSKKLKTKEVESHKDSFKNTGAKLGLSDFEVVRIPKHKSKQVIGVFKNGDVTINKALIECLGCNQVEIFIKNDGSQIKIFKEGEVMLHIPKTGRMKLSAISEKLNNRGTEFPVYYVGEWNEEERVWHGDLTTINPNRPNKKSKNNI